ncbi:MAG: pimeloyl-ACP methyl ester carboxylesterase [Akkermansiaceae bacterium]|jgi:pimeloyl-ACP methyl ester carboxylesterase
MNWKRIAFGKWSWKRPFYTLASVYLLLAIFISFMADSMIFQPPGTAYPENRAGFTKLGEGENEVAIFHLPAGPGMPTLLWSHGNAQNLASVKSALESFHIQGFGVISYDYPGYGESGGTPNEEGCYQNIQKAYQYLTQEAMVDPSEIILVGHSVGTGPTCWLAAREKHEAVVLISPFLSAFRTVTWFPLFPGDRFPNYKTIKKIETPLLVIHGEEDKVIPFSNGKALFELSPSAEKTFLPVPHAGHNNLFIRGDFDLASLILELNKK